MAIDKETLRPETEFAIIFIPLSEWINAFEFETHRAMEVLRLASIAGRGVRRRRRFAFHVKASAAVEFHCRPASCSRHACVHSAACRLPFHTRCCQGRTALRPPTRCDGSARVIQLLQLQVRSGPDPDQLRAGCRYPAVQ